MPVRLLPPTLSLLLLACAGRAAEPAEPGAGTSIARLDGSRWLWVSAECSDGAVDLATLGFDQELFLSVQQSSLLMTYETSLATKGCDTTEIWRVSFAETGQFGFEPQSRVTLPAGADCGARASERVDGALRLSDDTLEVVTARSPWCRGFDARFVYRRVPSEPLDARALVTRYVAHFNRRDAEGMAHLFSEAGSLVEPFSHTADGNYRRHQGRGEIRAWYASAFAGTPWLAMRLLEIDTTDEGGQVAATWEYMDENLKAPIRGRNLFVLAGGEIFESEVQLISEPVPATLQAPSVAEGGPGG